MLSSSHHALTRSRSGADHPRSRVDSIRLPPGLWYGPGTPREYRGRMGSVLHSLRGLINEGRSQRTAMLYGFGPVRWVFNQLFALSYESGMLAVNPWQEPIFLTENNSRNWTARYDSDNQPTWPPRRGVTLYYWPQMLLLYAPSLSSRADLSNSTGGGGGGADEDGVGKPGGVGDANAAHSEAHLLRQLIRHPA